MPVRRDLPPMFTRRSILPVVMVFLLGVFVARAATIWTALRGGQDWPAAVGEVRDALAKNHIRRVDAAALSRAAITGMLDALDDDYAQLVTPDDHAVFEKELTGAYVGIGAQVILQDGWLTIVSPMEDSPALRAGLLPADRVVAIDSVSTRGMSIDDCVDRLLGEPGSTVTLTVERVPPSSPRPPRLAAPALPPAPSAPASDPSPADAPEGPGTTNPASSTLDVVVTRGPILARTIRGVDYLDETDEWDYWLDRDAAVAYVRLSQFTPTCAAELARVLDSLGAARGGLRALVLDLRDNPGGTFEQAVEIADMFLTSGRIVSTRDREGTETVTSAAPEGTLPDFPLALLVNNASASASEILAGALADNGRAVVLGTRTFGKGIVQTVRPLRSVDGAILKFTHQRYVLPSGRTIHREDDSEVWGVDPTDGFYVPMTPDQERDRFLQRRAHEALRSGNLAHDEHWNDPEWIEASAADPQLAAAVRAIRVRFAEGRWVGDPGRPASADAAARDERDALISFRDQIQRELARIGRRLTALRAGADPVSTDAPPPDLWPDAAPVAGGRLEVFDRDGNPVARLRVPGADLESWLLDAGLTPDPETPSSPHPPG